MRTVSKLITHGWRVRLGIAATISGCKVPPTKSNAEFSAIEYPFMTNGDTAATRCLGSCFAAVT